MMSRVEGEGGALELPLTATSTALTVVGGRVLPHGLIGLTNRLRVADRLRNGRPVLATFPTGEILGRPMPELPEVETMVRDLRDTVTGRTIQSATVSWDRLVGYPDRPSFERDVRGGRIESIERRGKFALLQLSGNLTLGVHRGMT